MEFIYTKSFRKAFTNLNERQQAAVQNALESFQNDRTLPALRDHALKGKLLGLRSISAGWDLRIIYREQDNFVTVILLDAGGHNQVHG
jgi:addiction module RelE/StbE family toxin